MGSNPTAGIMFIFLLLLEIDRTPYVECKVDKIELNTTTLNQGLTQLIFWDYNTRHKRWECRDYRVHGHSMQIIDCVRRDVKRKMWVASWYDGGRLIYVYAPIYKITNTDNDPEVDNRKIWPLILRKEL